MALWSNAAARAPLSATLPDDTSVTVAPGKVTSNAEDTECTGNLLVQGNLIVNGVAALNVGMNVKAGAGGGPATMVEAVIQTTMEMTANGISLLGHKPDKVKQGDDDTDGPK